ncbi:MAG: ATP-binding protein [Bacillota bacterium]
MLEDSLGKVIFDLSPLRIAVLSVPDYRYEKANPAQVRFYESMGVTDFIGRKWSEVWKGKPYGKVLEVFDKVARSGQPVHLVDGPLEAEIWGQPRVLYASYYYYPLLGPDGSVEHIMWFGGDTTEIVVEKKAQKKALAEAQREHRAMEEILRAVGLLHAISSKVTEYADLQDLASAILEAAVRITHAELGTIQLVDSEADALTIIAVYGFGSDFTESFRTVHRCNNTSCATAWRTGERVAIEDTETSPIMMGTPELEIYRRSGVRAVQSTPILSPTGEVLGMLSTHFREPVTFGAEALKMVDMLARLAGDVIDWRRLESARQEAQLKAEQKAAEWGTLVNASPVAVYVLDEQGRILDANPAWRRSLGLDDDEPAENIGEIPHLGFTSPDGRTILPEERPTARALRGESVVDYPYRLVNKKGQELEFLHTATAVDTPLGRRVFSIVKDVTELRRLERLKDEFMLVISHELRNPLQVILGQAQLMSLKMTPEMWPVLGSSVESLTVQARLLSSLVDDLLNAYRVRNGRLSVDLTTVDFRALTLSVLEGQLVDTDHEWSSSLGESGILVIADPQRLSQAITNLLTNARKYTPVGGHVRLEMRKTRDAAILSVEDDGPGIPPQDLEKVFEGFYRTPERAKWHSGSIGLGLFISRGLVRRMGGDLWAENRPGGGTVMRLKMPLANGV